MHGYPGVIQVKDVVKEQEELLLKHIDDVGMIMEERKKELEKLASKLKSPMREEGF